MSPGGAILFAGAFVLAASTDLPFGTLASPGAGMLPTVVAVLMMIFAATLLLAAGASPPIGEVAWGNAAHAMRLIGVTAAAIALYTWLGFIATILLLLLVLTYPGRTQAPAARRRLQHRGDAACLSGIQHLAQRAAATRQFVALVAWKQPSTVWLLVSR